MKIHKAGELATLEKRLHDCYITGIVKDRDIPIFAQEGKPYVFIIPFKGSKHKIDVLGFQLDDLKCVFSFGSFNDDANKISDSISKFYEVKDWLEKHVGKKITVKGDYFSENKEMAVINFYPEEDITKPLLAEPDQKPYEV